MRRSAPLRLAGLLLAACLALTGCAGGPQPDPESTATPEPAATPAQTAAQFALACYPEAGFHPITGANRTNLSLCGLMYEGLFALDQHFQPQEQLCSSYTVSADALSWTFTLRQGVSFSDGTPLTAAQVVSSLEQARTSALYSARFVDIGAITAGDGTVTVALRQANGALPALLDIPVVREGESGPVGTGPYVLTGAGDTLALTARSGWWQGKELPLETIPLRTIQEADELIHAFDTRDIALVSTDLTGTNALGFSGSFNTVDYPTSNMLYVGFNTASGPCRSAAVRQALQHAFDRASVATVLLSRHAQAAALPISPASPYYPGQLAEELEYSSQALADGLAAAGWTRTEEGWVQGGQTLSLTLAAPANNADRLAVAESLAAGLQAMGIQTQLQALTWEQYVQALTAGDFDLYLAEVRLTADFDLSALIAPGGSLNYGGYSDAQATQLLAAYRAAVGQGRDLAGRRLYERLAEEPPFAVLCFKNWSVLTQWSRISDLTPTQQNVFYNFAEWSIT